MFQMPSCPYVNLILSNFFLLNLIIPYPLRFINHNRQNRSSAQPIIIYLITSISIFTLKQIVNLFSYTFMFEPLFLCVSPHARSPRIRFVEILLPLPLIFIPSITTTDNHCHQLPLADNF